MGGKYATSAEGSTALMMDSTSKDGPKAFSFSEQIQPGLTKPFRLVFDVNPEVRTYTLHAAGNAFEVTLP